MLVSTIHTDILSDLIERKGWCPMSIIESHDISPSAGAWQSTMRVCISSPIVCMITEIE